MTTFLPLRPPRQLVSSSPVARRAQGNGAPSFDGQPQEPRHRRQHIEVVEFHPATMERPALCPRPPAHCGTETVSENLNATFVQLVRPDNVHVLDATVGGDPPTCFATNACRCRFESEPTTSKHPRHSICCTVVATGVEPQAAKEKNTEDLCVKKRVPGNRTTREKNAGKEVHFVTGPDCCVDELRSKVASPSTATHAWGWMCSHLALGQVGDLLRDLQVNRELSTTPWMMMAQTRWFQKIAVVE